MQNTNPPKNMKNIENIKQIQKYVISNRALPHGKVLQYTEYVKYVEYAIHSLGPRLQ
jgi:hypothetical protein